MEPVEGLDTSLDESNYEADKENTSNAGKQQRGKSATDTKIEMMVKEIGI